MSQPVRARPALRLLKSAPESPDSGVPDDVTHEVAVARRPSGSLDVGAEALSTGSSSSSVVPSQRSPLHDLADAELVALGSQGNRKALELLYRRYASFAINLAIRLQGNARDVDDVVHDAFIKAFERLSTLRDPSLFRAWLGSIVLHQVRSNLRRLRVMRVVGLGAGGDEVDLDALAAPGISPLARAQLAQVYALLRTQPVDERIAWVLRYVEGHELCLVAELTNCSLATVKRRILKVQRFLDDYFVNSKEPDLPGALVDAPQGRTENLDRGALDRGNLGRDLTGDGVEEAVVGLRSVRREDQSSSRGKHRKEYRAAREAEL